MAMEPLVSLTLRSNAGIHWLLQMVSLLSGSARVECRYPLATANGSVLSDIYVNCNHQSNYR